MKIPIPIRFAGVLGAAALSLGLLARVLVADEVPTSFGGGAGGDTVGSLPMMAGPGHGSGGDELEKYLGPVQPAFGLEGLEVEIQALILDAYPLGPDAGFERIPLANGRVRYQFIGRVGLVLDRTLVGQTLVGQGTVRSVAVIGATFHGGMAQIAVGGQVRAQQALLMGVKDLRLAALDDAGVLAQGLNWHGVSPTWQHRVFAVRALDNTIKIEQRD
jgi:hypothetical protein